MTVRLSLDARNAVLEALNTRLAGGTVRIYTGTQPGAVSVAATGTILAVYTLPATFGVVAAGVLTASALPYAAVANATGTPGYARFFAAGGTVPHMDLSVTGSNGAGEMKVDNMEVKAGATVTITAIAITAPSP